MYIPNNGAAFDAVNAAARQIGTRDANDRIYFVPTNERLTAQKFNTDVNLNDGVHFSLAGGDKFAIAWRPTLDEAFRKLGPLC